MRKRLGFLCALVLAGALLTGCTDDGGTDYEALAVAFEGCSQESIGNLLHVFYALMSVPDSIETGDDEPIAGYDVVSTVELPPPAAPNTWGFVVLVDTNVNGVPDTTVSGTAVFSEDPTDGLAPGATIQVSFQVDSGVLAGTPADTGTLTGSGDLVVTVGIDPDEATITGTASLVDGPCSADLTVDESDPLDLRFNDFESQLAADLGLIEIAGLVRAFLETQGHDFDGDLDIEGEGDTVFVTGLIDDTVAIDTEFDLVPPQEAFGALLGCISTTINWLQLFGNVMDDISTVIESGTVDGVAVTPAGANTWDYAINLAVYDPANFTGGTVSGRATAFFFTQLAGFSPSEVTVTWTVAGATFASGDVTNGQNAPGRPLRFHMDAGLAVAFSGAGSFSTTLAPPPLAGGDPTIDCDTTFDIPDDRPIDILVEGADGLLLMTVDIEGYFMALVGEADDEEAYFEVNGVPFPFFLD